MKSVRLPFYLYLFGFVFESIRYGFWHMGPSYLLLDHTKTFHFVGAVVNGIFFNLEFQLLSASI